MTQLTFDDFITMVTCEPQMIEDHIVFDILRYGSNTTECRKILLNLFAEYDIDEIAKRLPKLYHGGYGYIRNDTQYAAWYDESGIMVHTGTSAKDKPDAHIVSWREAAEMIQRQIRNGVFATQEEIDDAPLYERRELAKAVWYMYRDIEQGYADMITTMMTIRGGGFPQETERLAELLNDERHVAKLTEELRQFADVYNADHGVMRFKMYNPVMILKRVEALNLHRNDRPSIIRQHVDIKPFITDDEIDTALAGGSGVSGGKLRIYKFMTTHHDERERVTFLKNEFGIGGHSHAVSGSDRSDERHDAKGITLKKQDCPVVNLTWQEVASRIDRLIRDCKYLNDLEEHEVMYAGYKAMEFDEFATAYCE